MSLINEIKSIEKPAIRNIKWYYHGFKYNDKAFKNMIKHGLKSYILRFSGSCGINNGPFFISVSHDKGNNDEHSSFLFYNQSCSSFIIDNIMTYPCVIKGDFKDLASILPFPLRPKAGWNDEKQAFLIVPPSKFVGIQCPLIYSLSNHEYSNKEHLVNLREMILTLKELNLDIPIFDYSRMDGENVHIVDKDEFLILEKSIKKGI